jgi:hypothetical protein
MGFVQTGPDLVGEVPLFELADNVANGNKQCGHIALVPAGSGATEAYFLDVGPVLKFTAQFGGEMAPATVRELASELNAWADRRCPR